MDRSVKQAGFLVLRQAAMPSVLVEVGFISHPNERDYMLSEHGKSTLSASIFNAFKAYKKKIEEKSSFVIHAEPGSTQKTISESKTVSGESSSSATIDNKTSEKIEENTGSIFFSVQIAASKKKLNPLLRTLKERKMFSGKKQTKYQDFTLENPSSMKMQLKKRKGLKKNILNHL